MDFSRESTSTLQQETLHGIYQDEALSESAMPSPENVPDSLLEGVSPTSSRKRLIIAVDFGTTYSSVSYVALKEGESAGYLPLDRIYTIQNFPNDWNSNYDEGMKSEVPTEVIYPLNPLFREKEDLDPMDEDSEDSMDEGNDDPMDETGDGGAGAGGEESNHDNAAMMAWGYQDDDDVESVDDESNSFRWGYGVHEVWALPATHSDQTNKALSRFKLLLDESPTTKTIRTQLGPTLATLRKKKVIKGHVHVIADFLTCLLRHTKSQLSQEISDNSYKKEMVLCVPAIWSQKACRDMQTAMAIAMSRARFDGVDIQNNSIENLFIVSEPEAAAAYVLANERGIMPGDTFVLLDAGGGTVDANTYTVSATTPLRLTREVVAPGGGLYGSSYLNEAFRTLLNDLLAGETYLENETDTIGGIVEKIMINEFEYRVKRSFDCYAAKGKKLFSVSGLRDNAEKHFRRGCINISTEKIKEIFFRCLEGIAAIMEGQIKAAMRSGSQVEKVLLIGGFAGSESLRKFLEFRLAQFCRENNCNINLIIKKNTTTAVSAGAVLRAFNKEQGPQRQARSSYGILRTEPFMEYPEHTGLKPYYDHDDGLPYIKNTIDWVLKLGAEVPPVWTCRPFLCNHTFRCWPLVPLKCREVLYVSDTSTQSHYRLNDQRNEGAERVGEIVVDFTYLRDQNLIFPIEPTVNDNGKKIGSRHYKVSYTMVIRVVDRDLECYAIYNGEVKKRCRINIASGFIPGVK